MKKRIEIYRITSPTNKIYIGQSVNLDVRFSKYKGLHCKSQTLLYRSFVKYGFESHQINVLFEFTEIEQNELDALEKKIYLEQYIDGMMLNIREPNGSRGKHSEDSKRKLSHSNRGKVLSKEQRLKMSLSHSGYKNHNYGKKMSDEQKLKISNTLKGRFIGINNPMFGKKVSEETRMKISNTKKHKK